MKKILSIALGMMMSGSVSAASSSDWAKYNEMKAAKYNSVSETVAAKIAIAEFATASLGRDDIAGWNYNNAAFVLIDEFKTKTDYAAATAKIEDMAKSPEKTQAIEAFKTTLAVNMSLLNEAEPLLEKAIAAYPADGLVSKVNSNKSFIRWVKKFINK